MHFCFLRTKKKTQTDFSEKQKSTQMNEKNNKIKHEISKRQTEALKFWNEPKSILDGLRVPMTKMCDFNFFQNTRTQSNCVNYYWLDAKFDVAFTKERNTPRI